MSTGFLGLRVADILMLFVQFLLYIFTPYERIWTMKVIKKSELKKFQSHYPFYFSEKGILNVPLHKKPGKSAIDVRPTVLCPILR